MASDDEISKMRYIEENEEWFIHPQFDDAESFREGFARVKLNDKWGNIKTDGKYLIEPMFDMSIPFEDGFARVCLNGELKYIDSNGTIKSDKNR